MAQELPSIDLLRLLLGVAPALALVAVLARWALEAGTAVYALLRMGLQLLGIGYLLVWIFEAETVWIVAAVLTVMVAASSWIALRAVRDLRAALLPDVVVSILAGGGTTLLWITQVVLQIDPWWAPSALIPLAGMAFATAMNGIALAAERYRAELRGGAATAHARNRALRAALIPRLNSLFAMGLVALPGMMTGQILAGVSPLVATRYQIMVMCMLFAGSGLSAACFLTLAARRGHLAPDAAPPGDAAPGPAI